MMRQFLQRIHAGAVCAIASALVWAAVGTPADGAMRAGPTRARMLEPGVYRSAAAAREVWKPGESGIPEAAGSESGLKFSCPFAAAARDRFYWNRTLSADLSDYPTLEMEITVPAPQAFRAMNVYLESGKGWYIATPRIPRPGRQRIALSKSDFSQEGPVAGWGRIGRIRISAWRGETIDTSFLLHGIVARASPICLVRGTLSCEKSEQRIASDVADRISGWLDRMAVRHSVLTEEEVADGGLNGVRLAILGYNATLTAPVRRAVEAFLRDGGRLIVCYSSDPRLAAAMGLTLGEWKQSDNPLQWSSFRFEQAGARHMPDRIFQASGNLRLVRPANADARVIAWWEDEQGRRTGDPAWVESPSGFWMSHILQADDGYAKQHMLAAMVAGFCPEVWPEIARAATEQAGRIDSFDGFESAAAWIQRAANADADGAAARGLVTRAIARRERMVAMTREGRYGEVLDEARLLRRELTEAYARVQTPAPGEFRGVWDHSGLGWYPGDWKRTCRLLADCGVTAVFPNLAWGGRAHFPSRILPGSYSLRAYGDQCAQAVAAAHAMGLQAHVWIVCWNPGEAPDDWIAQLRREGRLQQGPDGRITPWLNPAHPANQEMMLKVIREVASNYAVDGIHLDYIRYPGSQYDFSPWTRSAFERERGRAVARWPADVRNGGPDAAAFQQWRTEQINTFVRRARATLREARPTARLSAAVFAEYPDCVATVGQDWGRWLREGWVDFVCPMTYTETLAKFTADTARHLRVPAAPGRVYPGIGVSANESRLTADQTIEQILALRKTGAPGFLLFNLNPELRDEILPMLRLGVTRQP